MTQKTNAILLVAIVELPVTTASSKSGHPRVNTINYNNNYDRVFGKKASELS